MLQGVDLREIFASLDGEDTFNVIDALIIEDALLGAELEAGTLDKMRTAIIKVYNPGAEFLTETSDHHDVLDEDTDIEGFKGDLREAPLG